MLSKCVLNNSFSNTPVSPSSPVADPRCLLLAGWVHPAGGGDGAHHLLLVEDEAVVAVADNVPAVTEWGTNNN